MESSEESRLDSALRRGLRRIEGLPESARFADENITKYLKQKIGELMIREYKRRTYRDEDETAIAGQTSRSLDDGVLDAQKLYRLFELHMNKQLDEFWAGINVGAKTSFTGSYSGGAPRSYIGHRKFYCTEGCVFEGESAYLSHRDRGHHPVPLDS
jgi:hypothetical protein